MAPTRSTCASGHEIAAVCERGAGAVYPPARRSRPSVSALGPTACIWQTRSWAVRTEARRLCHRRKVPSRIGSRYGQHLRRDIRIGALPALGRRLHRGWAPTASTETKRNLSPVLGLEGYRTIAAQVPRNGDRAADMSPSAASKRRGRRRAPRSRTSTASPSIRAHCCGRTRHPAAETQKIATINIIETDNEKRSDYRRTDVPFRVFSSEPEIEFQRVDGPCDRGLEHGDGHRVETMKRIDMNDPERRHARPCETPRHPGCCPQDTSGVRDAARAVLAAQLAREAFGTDFIKLEIHPDPRYLLPDPVETLKPPRNWAKLGFVVHALLQADPVLCKRLERGGSQVHQSCPSRRRSAPTRPRDARSAGDHYRAEQRPRGDRRRSRRTVACAAAMELGADAVLVNTAIAVRATRAQWRRPSPRRRGRTRGYEAGLGAQSRCAGASSPLTAFFD